MKKWFLEGSLSDGKPWLIPINRLPFLIGRKESCNFSILSKKISRRHAELLFSGGEILINDLKSTNGTFVNGIRINSSTRLKDGDTIHFADMKFRIVLRGENEPTVETKTSLINHKEKSDSFVTYFDLTKREEEILYYLLDGKSTKKIADAIFVSEGTCKNHILNIFKKVNVHSRFELLALYSAFSSKK